MFIINSLVAGGAERVICALASRLAETGENWAVSLVTLDREEEVYTPGYNVERTLLDGKGGLLPSIHALLRHMRKERPDIVVSFLTRANCAAIVCSRILGIPCLISERVHTSSHFGSDSRRNLHKLMVRLLYPHADGIIAVSQGVAEDLIRNYAIPAHKVHTIYNPIDCQAIERSAQERPAVGVPSNYVVAVGRLVPNKNFPLLLRSFAAAHTESSLVILGEGPERGRLKELAVQLGIEGRVHMPGFVANPYAIVGRAEFFVSASNAEGFPNAILEAMCIGRAVIATDCDSGPSEILRDHTGEPKVRALTHADFGVLVPVNDESAISAAFEIMNDPDIRARLSVAARRRASHFSSDRTFAQYKELIEKTLLDACTDPSGAEPAGEVAQ